MYLMNELPVIGSCVMREGFWDRQGANIASRYKKMYSEKLFPRPKKRFWREINAFSLLFYQKWIWTMLIRGKCKFLFE